MTITERQQQRFMKWWENRSPAEFELHCLIGQLEQSHFADMRLATPQIRRALLSHKVLVDGRWIDDEDDLDLTIDDGWTFQFKRFRRDIVGLCDSKRRAIWIRPGLCPIEHRACVMHEMIHAYEDMLSRSYVEWLALHLHGQLSRKIAPANLRRYINTSMHLLLHAQQHGLLFLLKSLQLDLREGWPMGTVFGYGRTDYFVPKRRARN